MKIVFFGDSITDAGKNESYVAYSYGQGYLGFIAGELLSQNPQKYQIFNRGCSGHRIVDLYARIQPHVWNEWPDVLSILIGVNDVWHEIMNHNGVDIKRFEKVYRAIIEETLERLPDIKIILCEPFVLEGTATREHYEEFCAVKAYAKVVKRLAEEYGLYFLPLQKVLDDKAKLYASEYWLWDGVHPTRGGAKVIADEWLRVFKREIDR